MTTVASATTWGSPTATKHALLIHGLTSSSHTWHRVAISLAAQGYHVIAPNLIGHASRALLDCHISTIASDLRPYIEARTYDLIIGHSLGGVTTLNLLPYLPRSHPTAIILVDPPLNLSPEEVNRWKRLFIEECTRVKSAEVHSAENPLWTREDTIYKKLATLLCPPDTPSGILTQNQPWYFLDRLKDVSEQWKVSVLLADPAVLKLCPVDDLRPYTQVRHVIVPGAGHRIQSEYPDVIVEEALRRVAELAIVA